MVPARLAARAAQPPPGPGDGRPIESPGGNSRSAWPTPVAARRRAASPRVGAVGPHVSTRRGRHYRLRSRWGRHSCLPSRCRLARQTECLPHRTPCCPSHVARPLAPHVRLGIARDEAFHFYYPDNLESLAAGRCRVGAVLAARTMRICRPISTACTSAAAIPKSTPPDWPTTAAMLADVRRLRRLRSRRSTPNAAG